MKKKSKVILILILFTFIIVLSSCNKKYTIHYNIIINDDLEAEVTEKYDEVYHLNIKINEINFSYIINQNFGKKIVKEIKYIKDQNNQCIFLVFNKQKASDNIICNNSNDNYYLNTIENKSKNLLSFQNELIDEGYLLGHINDKKNIKKIDLIEVYENNLLDKKYIVMNSYKGLYIINKKLIKEVKLFNQDVYNPTIKQLINNQYIIADYNQEFEFDTFFLVDIKTGNVDKLNFNFKISFDSEIKVQKGPILYLYNRDDKIYYEVNIDSKTVKKVKEIKSEETLLIDDYKLISETKMKGYFTYYFLNDNKLYQNNTLDSNNMILLFNIDNKKDVKISKDYICYIDNNELSCYNNKTGYKTILKNEEFLFNKTISYDIFSE